MNKATGRINKASVIGRNWDLLRVVRSCWLVAARSVNTKIYWYGKRPDTLGTGFFAEAFKLVGNGARTWDPPAHFIKGSQQRVNLQSIGILPPAMVKKLLG